jgi:hypothetical protein
MVITMLVILMAETSMSSPCWWCGIRAGTKKPPERAVFPNVTLRGVTLAHPLHQMRLFTWVHPRSWCKFDQPLRHGGGDHQGVRKACPPTTSIMLMGNEKKQFAII